MTCFRVTKRTVPEQSGMQASKACFGTALLFNKQMKLWLETTDYQVTLTCNTITTGSIGVYIYICEATRSQRP